MARDKQSAPRVPPAGDEVESDTPARPVAEDCYDAVIGRVVSRLRPAVRRASVERRQLADCLDRLASSEEGYAALSEKEKRILKPWARLNLLWEASFGERYRDPRKMADLAFYAAVAARNLPTEVYGGALVADLQARALAELANADRVNDQLEQADRELIEARLLLLKGTGSPAVRARVADLEASLRRAQRRFPEALRLLEKARRLYTLAKDPHLAGKALAQKGLVLLDEGKADAAVRLFREGLSLLDQARDPALVATTQLTLARALALSGNLRQAGRLLLSSGLRKAFAGEPLNLLKLRALEGTILAGRGQHGRAEEILMEVRAGFKEIEQEYDAALVGLELAELWLQQGKLDAVQELASDTLATFRRLRIDVHALAAVQFLAECCRRKILSVKILSHVRDFLSRFQENPYLRFEYSG